MCAETTAEKQQAGPGRPFPPGRSGNPKGRPKGSRHAALVALDAIGQDGAEEILKNLIIDAKSGDTRAAEVLLRRAWPAPKGRPVELDLPPVESAADVARALGAVTQAIAAGEITPEEGQAVASVLETQRRTMLSSDFERRLAELEAKVKDQAALPNGAIPHEDLASPKMVGTNATAAESATRTAKLSITR